MNSADNRASGAPEPNDRPQCGAPGSSENYSGEEYSGAEDDLFGRAGDAYLDRAEDEVPSSDRDEVLAGMSPADRQRTAEVQWLHALLDQVFQGRTDERAVRKEAAISAAMKTIKAESESSKTSKRRWFMPVIWGAMTAAAASFAAYSLLWGPGETPVTAEGIMLEARAAASQPVDRTYSVDLVSASENLPQIKATLDVRGSDRFVVEFPVPLGRARAGSDGRNFWVVPAAGPVLVRDDSALLEAWINRAGVPLPILQITAALNQMSEHYDLVRMADEPLEEDGPNLRRVHGLRKSGPAQLPDRVDVWINEKNSVVEKATVRWNDGPLKEMSFTLQGETPRTENWYQHGAHHAPHRPVVRGPLAK